MKWTVGHATEGYVGYISGTANEVCNRFQLRYSRLSKQEVIIMYDRTN